MSPEVFVLGDCFGHVCDLLVFVSATGSDKGDEASLGFYNLEFLGQQSI